MDIAIICLAIVAIVLLIFSVALLARQSKRATLNDNKGQLAAGKFT